MSPSQFAEILSGANDKEIQKFLDGIKSSQSGVFNKVLSFIKGLELDPNGKIRANTENLKTLRFVKIELQKTVLTDSYRAKVERYINQMPKIKSVNDKYFHDLIKTFNDNKHSYKNLLNTSMELTANSLLDEGINTNVITPVKQMITDSITSNWTFEDLVDNLRVKIKGNDEVLGSVERYASQIATDGLNQYSANYTKSVSEDLGFEWYYYSGGVRKTSRPFCDEFAKKYFHKKEIEDFGKGKNLNGSNLSSDLKKGRIRGTNSSNIFTYRGGYNCKHQYIPTTVGFVPKKVIKRNIDKGYYKEKTIL